MGFSLWPLDHASEHGTPRDTPGWLQLWNRAALEDNGFLLASCLILLKSLAVRLHLFFLTRFPVDYLQQSVDGSLIAAQYLRHFKSAASI